MELMVDIKSLVRGKVSINTSNSERNWYESLLCSRVSQPSCFNMGVTWVKFD